MARVTEELSRWTAQINDETRYIDLKSVQPFSALVAVSSLLAALLYIAGFAYRWSYYYDFGAQHLVFKLGTLSFLATAFELIRTPRHLLSFVVHVVVPLLLFNLAMDALSVISRRESTTAHALRSVVVALGLGSPLVLDLLRAAVLVYGTYLFGSQLGYDAFRRHVMDSRANPLPAATVLIGGNRSVTPMLGCGTELRKPLQFIGDDKKILQLQERVHNRRTTTWRLLYRDDQVIYLFASESAEAYKGGRPLTVILPNREDTYLVLE